MKLTILILGFVLFFYSGYVQLNDPDWYLWAPIYWLICLLTALTYFKIKIPNTVYWCLVLIYSISLVLVASGIWDIASYNRSSMLSSEHWLEACGLVLCIGWLIVLRKL